MLTVHPRLAMTKELNVSALSSFLPLWMPLRETLILYRDSHVCSNIIQKLYKINDNVRSRLDIIYSLVRNDGFFRAYNSPIRLYTTRRSSVNDNENPFDSLISLWSISFLWIFFANFLELSSISVRTAFDYQTIDCTKRFIV